MSRFVITSKSEDGAEFAANLAYLAREWPWPITPQEIVMRLVKEEANKVKRIKVAVASHFKKKEDQTSKKVASAAASILPSLTKCWPIGLSPRQNQRRNAREQASGYRKSGCNNS